MSEKLPTLMERSVVGHRAGLWDRILTEPRYMAGSLAVIGIGGMLVWGLFSAMTPDDLSMEGGEGASLFDSRRSSDAAGSKKRRRRSRRLSVIPMDMFGGDQAEAPVLASAAPAAPSSLPASVTSAASGAAQPQLNPAGLGEPASNAQTAATDEGSRPAANFEKRDFNAKGGGSFGGAGGGGGGAPGGMRGGPSASADKTVLTASLARFSAAAGAAAPRAGHGQMRASSGFGGGGGAPSSLGATGSRPRSGVAGPNGRAGAVGQTGQDESAEMIGGSGGGASGSSGGGSLGGAPEVAGAAAAGGAESKGGGGGGGGGGGAANTGIDTGEKPATEADLQRASGDFLAAAEALESDSARPAMEEVARMTNASEESAGDAASEMDKFGDRVESDRTYFNVTYNQPHIAGSLDSVKDALNDPQDGVVLRLNSNKDRLHFATLCLRRFASGAVTMKTDMEGAVRCIKSAEGGLDQRERDSRKVTNIKTAVDRWSQTAKASIKPLCPKPTPLPLTPLEIQHCAALDYLNASAISHDERIGAAQTSLNAVQPNASVSNPLPQKIAEQREDVLEVRRILDDLVLPPGTPSAVLRAQVAEALVSLDFASGGWKKAATGGVPLEERAGEAARATSKLVTAIANLREAGRVATILAGSAPKK